MHEQRALTLGDRQRRIVDDFEILDARQRRMRPDIFEPMLVAAGVTCAVHRVNSTTFRSAVRRIVYCTVTRSVASSLTTLTVSA